MFSSEKTGIQTIQIVHFEKFGLLEVWKTPKDWAFYTSKSEQFDKAIAIIPHSWPSFKSVLQIPVILFSTLLCYTKPQIFKIFIRIEIFLLTIVIFWNIILPNILYFIK